MFCILVNIVVAALLSAEADGGEDPLGNVAPDSVLAALDAASCNDGVDDANDAFSAFVFTVASDGVPGTLMFGNKDASLSDAVMVAVFGVPRRLADPMDKLKFPVAANAVPLPDSKDGPLAIAVNDELDALDNPVDTDGS